MAQGTALGRLSELSAPALGAFRGCEAVAVGVTRKQLATMQRAGAIDRFLPDTYCLTAVATSHEQRLRAALLWAGPHAVAAGRSAAETYRLENVRATQPEIVVPRNVRSRSPGVIVHHTDDRAALMVRTVSGIQVTGVEATLLALAHTLDDEGLEIACEDARRRGLTSVAALRAYLERHATKGRRGVTALGRLLREVDAVHPARSTLEVRARRLLVTHGITAFEREFPLVWKGRTYRFDFGFPRSRAIVETNGRRWHDDPADYEHDHEKWSVPGRLDYRIVFATWNKVVRDPAAFIEEVRAMLR